MKKIYFLFILLATGLVVSSQVIQWRGPNRDGHFNETGLLQKWPEAGPKQILEVEGIGKGFSSPIPTENAIYVTGMKDTTDYLTAIDYTGKIKWQVPYGRSWKQSFPDTRVSPTIEGNRIYVLSGMGRLSCLNAETGKEIWSGEVDKDYEAEYHNWGVSESLLLVDDKVICTPGGKKTSVVALDKMTGKPVWQSECVGGQRSYVSPVIYENKNLRYILAATATTLIALNPANGKVACTYLYAKKPGDGLIWATSPLYKGYEIFITMGYNNHAVMLQLDQQGQSITKKYDNTVLDNHHGGVVNVGDYIYGANWLSNSKGKWVCLDWNTGETKYETEWFNKGSIIYADGMLYVMEEKTGNVGLVTPDPGKFDVVSTFQITKGSGPFWAHPYIAKGKLFIRHGDVLMVFDIKA
jgi:outer membrane protein assembly factor BamB